MSVSSSEEGIAGRTQTYLIVQDGYSFLYLAVCFYSQQVCSGIYTEVIILRGLASLALLIQQLVVSSLPRRMAQLCAIWDHCVSSGDPMTLEPSGEPRSASGKLDTKLNKQLKKTQTFSMFSLEGDGESADLESKLS